MICIRLNRNKMEKIRPVKNTWNEGLINCIPEPTANIVGGFKDKLTGLVRANASK